jgi:hypothetical protein
MLDYVDDEKKCGLHSNYLMKKLRLRKQRQVKMWMDLHPQLKTYEIYDRVIKGPSARGKERPDWAWNYPTHYVVLELDEFKHDDPAYAGDRTRMVKMTQSFGKPCLWVRYNPDDFKGQKSTLKERDRRELLERWLVECQTLTPQSSEDYCRVSYLYFDGFQIDQPIAVERIPMIE